MFNRIETEWNGHIKLRGIVSWNDTDTIFGPVGSGTFYDFNPEVRVINKTHFSEQIYSEAQYEAVLLVGDNIEKSNALRSLFPGLFSDDDVLLVQAVDDDRRFLNLTSTITDGDDHTLYHRLDRLNLSYEPDWGLFRIGRQAVTWGNGVLFGPMDLFNPFSPIDVEADHKIGDDMLFIQLPHKEYGDFQGLYLPRRDALENDLEWESSSLAGKFRFEMKRTKLDVMAAHHFEDDIIGLGIAQTIGKAVLRVDATWTFLDEESVNDDYLSLIANMDIGWTLWNKNFYCLIEYYHNGLGTDDPAEAAIDEDIVERHERGELFILGENYLNGGIQIEFAPTLNTFFLVVHNLEDSSGYIQPWITWNVIPEFQATLGGNVSYGGDETEFGGFRFAGTEPVIEIADSIFLFLTYYF